MYKLIFSVTFLSFMTINSVKSVQFEDNLLSEETKLQSTNSLTNAAEREQEFNYLLEGRQHLRNGNYEDAYIQFRSAVDLGSPLGYLYLGALSEVDVELNRYVNIALRAAQQNAIPQAVLYTHMLYLRNLELINFR